MNTVSYESCFDSLAGTPNKKRQVSVLAPSSSKRGTPASSSRNNRGDRFIPHRSAMDLDVSHFELTRAGDNENEKTNVNASPAKEECKRRTTRHANNKKPLLPTPRPSRTARARHAARASPPPECTSRPPSLSRLPRACVCAQMRACAALAPLVLLADNSRLAQTLMSSNPTSKVLAFKAKPAASTLHESSLRVLYTQNREAGLLPKKYSRHVPQAPERILDAPELLDDYYLNLLDCAPDGHPSLVALRPLR